jgi:hypothetical protein
MTSNWLDKRHLEVRSHFQGVSAGTLGSAIRLPGGLGVLHESLGSVIRLPAALSWCSYISIENKADSVQHLDNRW